MNLVDEWLCNNPPSPTMPATPNQKADRVDDWHHTQQKIGLDDNGIVSPAEDEGDISDTSSHFSSVSEDSPPAIHAYGHTYYGSGTIMFPNDASEANRLRLQHELFQLCLDGGLVDAKLPLENHSPDRPLQILDVGAGTGIWACEMAQRHPEVEVLGIDLTSSLLPKDVPHNATFEIADANETWPSKHYDFIHMRSLAGGGIRDWAALLSTAYDHLKPGGQLEFTELTPGFYDVDPEKVDLTKLDSRINPEVGASCLEYEVAFARCCANMGVDWDPISRVSEWLASSDCENIRARVDYLPYRSYGNDAVTRKKGYTLGKMVAEGIDNWTSMLFGSSGWNEKDMKSLMDRVVKEIQNPKFKSCAKVTFITARKPLDTAQLSSENLTSTSSRS